jgi:hypothetical protein
MPPRVAGKLSAILRGIKPHIERETKMKPHEHPCYDASRAHAVQRAFAARLESTKAEGYYPPCFKVYFDGKAMFVRTAEASPPDNAELVCIAQAWDKEGTVQLRYSGGHSEFINK